MASNVTYTDKFLPAKTEEFCLTISHLNAQLGVFDSLVVEQTHKFQKEEYFREFKEQIPTLNSEKDLEKQDSKGKEGVKRSGACNWIANCLTRIMYGLYDIGLVLGTNTLAYSDSRINNEEVKRITDMLQVFTIADQKGPVMPIGNLMATQCYVAVSLCQRSISQLRELPIEEDKLSIFVEYLSSLEKLLVFFARFSNFLLGNKDWYWKPIAETR